MTIGGGQVLHHVTSGEHRPLLGEDVSHVLCIGACPGRLREGRDGIPKRAPPKHTVSALPGGATYRPSLCELISPHGCKYFARDVIECAMHVYGRPTMRTIIPPSNRSLRDAPWKAFRVRCSFLSRLVAHPSDALCCSRGSIHEVAKLCGERSVELRIDSKSMRMY